MTRLYLHSFRTKIGTIRTAATEKGLAAVSLPGEPQRTFVARTRNLFGECDVTAGGTVNRRAEQEILKYLDGKLKKFSVTLDLRTSPFQGQVLRRVARIPYGRTMTYGEVARALGKPTCSRAVGTANARNNLPLVIPCHRVVAVDGLGGYGGGLRLKRKLLELEGAL